MNLRSHTAVRGTVALVSVLLSGCEVGQAAEPTADTSAVAQGQVGIYDPAQLPDPCSLVAGESIGRLIQTPVPAIPGDFVVVGGDPLLFRTCTWGETTSTYGAIGIQIGVPDISGHDVVANRSLAMDPALQTSVGEDGKETMNLGELPTGGGKGATIFFHHNGYSVLIGHVGPGSALGTVEDLALEVIATLDA